MTRKLLFLTSMACGLLALASPAHAQRRQPLERIRIAIELTDRRIQHAGEILPTIENPQASRELRAAHDLQRRAKDALFAGRPPLAMRATLEARRRADFVIAQARGLPDPDRVQGQVDRTRQMIDKTRGRIEGCGDPRARDAMREGFEMQGRSEDAMKSGRYLVALQLTMGARERLERSRRLCRLGETLDEAAAHAVQRTDDILGRIHDGVEAGGSNDARKAFERAMELQTRAHDALRAGDFESALHQTQSARSFGYRAARLAGVRANL